ncbi:AmmeMemoRadiSam system protein B, partial [Candidatus Peregrinibacteria bacterium]|nr:AmmeMemoRadiSam system protein B [Candidatus Peregrinibacteria bacterium]
MKREPAVAGMFYPADPTALQGMITSYLNEAKDFELPNLKGLICPHAGYVYSGPTAGVAYRQIQNRPIPENLFLIGPAHHVYIEAGVGNYSSFVTPLGEVPVNRDIAGKLEHGDFPFEKEAHRPEHCLEVQVPFIQMTAPKSSIIPILVGGMSPEELAKSLDEYFVRPDTFFIISSDLSHYQLYDEAVETDKRTLKIIEKLDIQEENLVDACGKIGIGAIMRLAKKHGYKIKLLDYRNSGDTAGDKSAVVGYGALA